MHKVEIVKSEQEKHSWLAALLRTERKQGGTARVVVFCKTEATALALHQKLRKHYPSAVNAGQHAADGLARFREGNRLVLVTPDGRVYRPQDSNHRMPIRFTRDHGTHHHSDCAFGRRCVQPLLGPSRAGSDKRELGSSFGAPFP